jgi:hypothetical protein
MMLERGVQSNWAKKPGVNPNILWLTRPFRESFRLFPGKSMRIGAAAARERRGIQLARAEKLHESCKSMSQCLRKCLIEAESLILHVHPT